MGFDKFGRSEFLENVSAKDYIQDEIMIKLKLNLSTITEQRKQL